MTDAAIDAGSVHVCRECDWTMEVPSLAKGESAHCPRCEHLVAREERPRADHVVAWSVSALVMLGLSMLFPFIHLEAQGGSHAIVLLDVTTALMQDPYAPVGVSILLCTVALPGVYLLSLAYISAGLMARRQLPGTRWLAMLTDAIKPWTMSEVFVFGVLISLIKVISLAGVQLGPAFGTFCAYALALLVALSSHRPERLWHGIAGPATPPADALPGRAAWQQNHAGCAVCGAVYAREGNPVCVRCGHRTAGPPQRHQHATWALILTAAVLFIPAMSYPVMTINHFGYSDPQTIVGGAWYLARTGSWPIALVILAASVIVPVGKLLALGWLCLRAHRPSESGRQDRIRLYRLTELVGRWSMIDVFVVAVLVALVQVQQIVSIEPGPGIIAFGAVVIVTMLAAMTFDPRAIWLAPAGAPESNQ